MDKPNVRMFVGEFGTVRWETKVKGKGLQLVVKGPRDIVTTHEFQDPLELVEFQSVAERRLLNTGYEAFPGLAQPGRWIRGGVQISVVPGR